MTDQEKKALKEALNNWKKAHTGLVKKYAQMDKLWMRYDMTAEEEKKCRYGFADTYMEDLLPLIELFSNYAIDPDAQAIFKEHHLHTMALDAFGYLKETQMNYDASRDAGLRDYLSSETDAEKTFRKTKLNAPDKNNLFDNTMTEDQKRNLREIKKYMLERADAEGFEYFGSNGHVRHFLNEFLKQPASVQMMTIYLVNSDKRKNPNSFGFDAVKAMSEENTMDPEVFKQKLEQNVFKQIVFGSRLDGGHTYWNKVEQAFQIAVKQAPKLERFRNEKRSILADNTLTEEEKQKKIDGSAVKVLLDRQNLAKKAQAAASIKAYLKIMNDKLKEIREDEERLENNPELANDDNFKTEYNTSIATLLQSANDIRTLCDENPELRRMTFGDKAKKNYETAKEASKIANEPVSIYRICNNLVANSGKIKYCLEKGTIFANPDADNVKTVTLSGVLGEKFQDLFGKKAFNMYDNISTSCLSAIEVMGNMINVVDYAMNIKNTSDKTTLNNIYDYLGASASGTMALNNSTKIAKTVMTGFMGLKETNKHVMRANSFIQGAGLFASGLNMIKGIWQAVKSWNHQYTYSKLKDRIKDNIDPNREGHMDKLKSTLSVLRKQNRWKSAKNTIGMVLGIAGFAASIIALPTFSLGVGIGATIGLGTWGITSVVDHIGSLFTKRAQKKRAVDEALIKKNNQKAKLDKENATIRGEKLRISDAAKENHKEHIRKKMNRYAQGSAERDYLEKFVQDDKNIKRMIRGKAAAEDGCLNANSFAKKLCKETIREAIMNVFFKDPNRGFTVDNLLTVDEYADLANNVEQYRQIDLSAPGKTNEDFKKRTFADYYDFLASAGVNMTMPDYQDEVRRLKGIVNRENVAVGELS